MEGNMLYHQYLRPRTEHYSKSPMVDKDRTYEVNNVSPDYQVIAEEGSVWTYYHVQDAVLPDQGWKIHLTATLEESQELLDKVSEFCIENKIEFKHLKNKQSFIKVNSKNANRASSGKFMTIYPPTNDRFLEWIELLEELTQDFEKGPYILSDKRWKNSNVFYRYGGFKLILNEIGEHCIKDKDGNLIRDERAPFYQVPDFVREFDEYLTDLNPNSQESEGYLEQYQVETALTYSNAGGVYLATRKKDDTKVIIKEARPNAGLDGAYKDALLRQKAEKHALTQLKDVTGIVDLLDYFKEWEHYFLVEEFIEGRDLRQWVSQEFPFIGIEKDLKEYSFKVKRILTQLYNLVEKMHERDVAMGDLQPANVMVMDDGSVKLIDFETSVSVKSNESPAMATIGFVSKEMKVSGARDWYGLKKLIKYLALPVLSSEDLDGYLQDNQWRWLRENYEDAFFYFVVDMQGECEKKIKELQPYNPTTIDQIGYSRDYELKSIIDKLVGGLRENLIEEDRLIHGDIRQFEMEDGKFNFLTGASGAAFALDKNDTGSEEVERWIDSFGFEHLKKSENPGLFTGKTGMLALLYERGFTDVVERELIALHNQLNVHDISLRSGLSGIGLFALSVYVDSGEEKLLEVCLAIEELIEENRGMDEPFQPKDWMAVDRGLIDGLSGASLFYSALYAVTEDARYLVKAEAILREDLEFTQWDETTGSLQTLDSRNRLLPYLSGGSIGTAVSMWYYQHVSGLRCFEKEINGILKVSKTRCTISGGLFDGAGSFTILPALVEDKLEKEGLVEDVLHLLNLFLINKDDYYAYPGQFSYRLSDDIYTGSSGIILSLMGIYKNNPLHWMPLVHSDKFLKKTKRSKVHQSNV